MKNATCTLPHENMYRHGTQEIALEKRSPAHTVETPPVILGGRSGARLSKSAALLEVLEVLRGLLL